MLVPRLGRLAFRLLTSSNDLLPWYSLCIHSHVRENITEPQGARACHRNFSIFTGREEVKVKPTVDLHLTEGKSLRTLCDIKCFPINRPASLANKIL